jgi:uncharacterized protein (TIGR02588 family)
MRQNWVEWTALGVSVLATLGLAGFLVVDGLVDEGAPPAPTVELRSGDAYESDHGWIIPATVGNDGDEAAEAVILEATASVGGTEETSVVDVDYLPAGTEVDVSFGFSARPDGDVALRVVGFRLP